MKMKTITSLAALSLVAFLTVAPSVKAVESTTAGVEFIGGDLQFTSATDAIDFGTIDLTGGGINAPATTPMETVVTDARGTGAGWNITAQRSEFTEGILGEDELEGATLSLSEGVASPAENSPTAVAPTPTPYAEISTDTPTQVLSAVPDAGLGEWNTGWAAENITLEVPASEAREGQYQSTITWTLSDAPIGGSPVEDIVTTP